MKKDLKYTKDEAVSSPPIASNHPKQKAGSGVTGEGNSTATILSDDRNKGLHEQKDLRGVITQQTDSRVSPEEKKDLERAANDMPGDDENLRKAALDDHDEDGDPLNEDSFSGNVSSSGLDIPGADLDDDSEATGSEDEENNDYSLGDPEEDNGEKES